MVDFSVNLAEVIKEILDLIVEPRRIAAQKKAILQSTEIEAKTKHIEAETRMADAEVESKKVANALIEAEIEKVKSEARLTDAKAMRETVDAAIAFVQHFLPEASEEQKFRVAASLIRSPKEPQNEQLTHKLLADEKKG